MLDHTNNDYGIVLVTVSSETEARTIAQTLIQEKLGACINFFPVTSIYCWQEEICEDREYQLIIKTNLNKFSILEQKIKEIHSYEVPEIIAIPILKGSESYLLWLKG